MRIVEMSSLRHVYGIRKNNQVRKEVVRDLYGMGKILNERIKEVNWPCCKSECDKVNEKVWQHELFGNKLLWRPRRKWIDCVKDCVGQRGWGGGRGGSVDKASRLVYNRVAGGAYFKS